jgi:CRISPR-associated protein Csb2
MGQELIDLDSKRPIALLSLLPESERQLQHFIAPSSIWDTVSPIILPGHDDGRASKTERLLRTAIGQAGLPELLATHARLEWRQVGFRPGVDVARRYRVPAYLQQYPRYHVRIEWCDSHGDPVMIGGPLVIGGGRFSGFGLLARTVDGMSR